ncbi:MAG: hypothetical protein HYV08_12045, partial [Deltaproteobacteria bacterium]|nr:hypothetical protein [Deltaproteobacteria bacterium]
VSPDSLTIRGKIKGQEKDLAFFVTAKTAVRIGKESKPPGDVKEGDRVLVGYTAANGKMIARSVTVLPPRVAKRVVRDGGVLQRASAPADPSAAKKVRRATAGPGRASGTGSQISASRPTADEHAGVSSQAQEWNWRFNLRPGRNYLDPRVASDGTHEGVRLASDRPRLRGMGAWGDGYQLAVARTGSGGQEAGAQARDRNSPVTAAPGRQSDQWTTVDRTREGARLAPEGLRLGARDSWGDGSRLAFAQTGAGSQETGAQAQDRNWRILGSAKGYYDDWRNDGDVTQKGHQFTEIYGLGFEVSRLLVPSGVLSVFAEGGKIQSKVTSGSESTRLNPWTDTTVTATYSTFDGKTWGIEGSLSFNVPTGKTRLTELERRAIPNLAVVSRSPQGVGYDRGGKLRLLLQADKLHLYAGGGYTRRGEFDPTQEIEGDTSPGGDEYEGLLGANLWLGEAFNIGLDASYRRITGVGDQDINSYTLELPATLVLGSFTATGRLGIMYTDSTPRRGNTALRIQERFVEQRLFLQAGTTGTASLELAYRPSEALTLRVFGEGAVGAAERPFDPTFFAFDERLAVGLGVSWAIPGTPLTLDLTGKYFEVFSETTDREDDFSGYSAFVGLSLRF